MVFGWFGWFVFSAQTMAIAIEMLSVTLWPPDTLNRVEGGGGEGYKYIQIASNSACIAVTVVA